MIIDQYVVVFDAHDIDSESTFWAALMGGEIIREDHWNDVTDHRGDVRLSVQRVENYTPPHWPDGVPQQLHLDLHVGDIAAAHAHVIALGARVIGAPVDITAPRGFQVYADPAGHPFCLCWGGG